MSQMFLFCNTDTYKEAVYLVQNKGKFYEFNCVYNSVKDIVRVAEPVDYLALNDIQNWDIEEVTYLFKLKCVSNTTFIIKISDPDKLLELLNITDKYKIKACIKNSKDNLLELKRKILVTCDSCSDNEYEVLQW